MLRNTCVLLMLAVSAWSASAKEADDQTPGLKVGATAPDFELSNQSKKKTKLSELLKSGPVAVVFHRSAQW